MIKYVFTLLMALARFPAAAQDPGNANGKEKDDTQISAAAAKSDRIFKNVEVQASFPGGQAALNEFINENLTYPDGAYDENIQGKVRLRLVVERDGSISQIMELDSPDPRLTEEAERIVRLMPKWNPANIHNEAVRSYVVFPITFKIG